MVQQRFPDAKVVLYMKEGISADDLRRIIKKMKVDMEFLVRKKEDFYKENLAGKELTENEWIDIIRAQPQLLHRPIVETDNEAVIGRPVEALKGWIARLA